MWLSLFFIASLLQTGGNAALFSQNCFFGCAIWFLNSAMQKRGKCCPFFSKNVWDTMWLSLFFTTSLFQRGNAALFLKMGVWDVFLTLENCYAKQGEMLPIFPPNVWYAMWLSLLLISSLFQTGGNAVLFSENWGVQFDSWGLLCNTGENAALFFKKLLGMQCDFHVSWFPLCSKLRWALPFSTKRMCNLILQTCYVKQGEMLPILVQNVCAMWLSLLFTSSLFQAGGNAALFLKRIFGRAIWFLKPAMENRGKCCPLFKIFLGVRFDPSKALILQKCCSEQGTMLPIFLNVTLTHLFSVFRAGGNAALFSKVFLRLRVNF